MKPAFAYLRSTLAYFNIGDEASYPAQYFDEYGDCIVTSLDGAKALPYGQPVILGGGGLLLYSEYISQLARERPVIIWGAGINSSISQFDEVTTAAALRHCQLVGIRDRRFASAHGFEYVPCASAMHPLFSSLQEGRGLLIYQHAWESKIPDLGFPHIRLNNMDRESAPDSVIRAICNSSTVITNSYHGAYWSQLAGKRVILWQPPGLRFYSGLPYVPCIVHTEEQLRAAFDFSPGTAKLTALVCRATNQEFANKVNHFLKTL